MAVDFAKVSGSVFEVLKSHGFKLDMYAEDGAPAVDPYTDARRFYVKEFSMMVSVNRLGNDDDEISVSYPTSIVDKVDISALIRTLRSTATRFGLLFNVQAFEREFEKKNYAFLSTGVDNDVKESIITLESGNAKNDVRIFLSQEGFNVRDIRVRPSDYVNDVWIALLPYERRAFVVYLSEKKYLETEYYETQQKYFSANDVFEAKDVGKLKGTSLTSNQHIGKPKLIVRHSKPVDENKFAARTRNIDKIFVETVEGERFKFPVNYLQGARAMTRHMQEGGEWNDDIGNYIKESCVEMYKLKEFRRQSSVVNEETEVIKDRVSERYFQIAKEMKKLQGPKTYQRFAEQFTPNEKLDEDITTPEVTRLSKIYNNIQEDILECVAKLTIGMVEQEEPQEEVINRESVNDPLNSFNDWALSYNLDEDDSETELTKDLNDKPILKKKIKKDPKVLNKYLRKR